MTRRPATTAFTMLCAALTLASIVALAQDDAASRAASSSPGAPPPRAPRRLPGLQAGGSILLPTQWSLRPAGDQIVLGDFPTTIAVHPSGRWAAVLHAGYGEHEIIVVDLKSKKVVSRATMPETFYGLTFDAKGRRLFASAAQDDAVYAFGFDDGYLASRRTIPIRAGQKTAVTGGLAVSPDGRTLYAASPWGDAISLVPLGEGAGEPRQIAAAAGSAPYVILPSPDGARAFVSLWGASSVAVVDRAKAAIVGTWPTAAHPTEMALSHDGARLFVACANSNSVSVLDAKSGKPLETIETSLEPRSPPGSTPSSLALSPDGRVLAVANSDINAIALFDVSKPAASAPLGFIPAGWYPTSVRWSTKGDALYVANGKGIMPKANRQGPNPLRNPPTNVREYIAGLFRGTLAVIPAPSPKELADYTRKVLALRPERGDATGAPAAAVAGSPIPSKRGEPSPIQHVIFIIKENRTYDQVFGDVPEGNGDPTLCIFPAKVTPNHHALAATFVLLDNFYVESEVSADGHEWTMAAYATDYTERSWPLVYRDKRDVSKLGYPSGDEAKIAASSGGYLWDRARAAGLSYRVYGEFITNGKRPEDPSTTTIESLQGHFDPHYRGYDLDYPDQKRADRFLEELKGFEATGAMPRLIIMHLPNDHTSGAAVGKPTPTAYLADNDLALGRIVEGVSKSRFWKDTTIFVVQDDAQNGSDHVDAHRTVALVVGPYVRRGAVDSTLYSTTSMLATIERILGLAPMSQFDAAARPMDAAFTTKADLAPYEHRPAGVDLTVTNTASAWGADRVKEIDLARADAADDLLLGEMVWRSVRGPNSPMPPPVRAAFVFPHPKKAGGDPDGDDD